MIAPTTLTLVRHGESVGNIKKLFHGITDSALTSKGLEQANRVAHFLNTRSTPFSALYCSPLQRAHQTAKQVAKVLQMKEQVVDDLHEIDFGSWEELTIQELRDDHQFWEKAQADDDFAPHGGESPRMLGNRVAQCLQALVVKHPGEHIIAVGHGAAYCSALAVLLQTRPLLGVEYFMVNCSVTELLFDPTPRMTLHNEASHLDE